MKNENTPDYSAAPTEDSFGFYGTIMSNEKLSGKQAEQAWKGAFAVVRDGLAEGNKIMARNYLRTRQGRHLADSCSRYQGTIEERVQQALKHKGVARDFNDMKSDPAFGTELFSEDQLLD